MVEDLAMKSSDEFWSHLRETKQTKSLSILMATQSLIYVEKMDWYDDWLLSSTFFLKKNLSFKQEGDCFIRVSKQEETDEWTRKRAECF